MARLLIAISVLVLSACTALKHAPSDSHVVSVMVTGISSGRASVPSEKTYSLRTATGYVYFVRQSLTKPLKEGDTTNLEVGSGNFARIIEK